MYFLRKTLMPVLSIQINNIATMGNQFQQNYLLKNEYFIQNIMNGFLNGMDSTFIVKRFMIAILVLVKITYIK